jgi:hypothetical protein
MATKQDEFLPPTRYQAPAIVPRRSFGMTPSEQRSRAEFEKQIRVMEQERIKSRYAAQAIADIDTHAYETGVGAVERMYAIKQQARPPDLQAIVDQMFKNSHQRLDAHLSYSADMGAGLILDNQQKPTYVETQMKEVGTIRKRLKEI